MERMIYVDVIRCGVDREYVSRIMVWIYTYMSADESYLLVCLIYVYGRWRVLLFIKDTEGHIKESVRG